MTIREEEFVSDRSEGGEHAGHFCLLAHARCPPPPFLETIVTINLTEARTIMQRENRCSLLASFFIDGSQNHRDFNFREKQSYTIAESISYLRVTCGQQTSMFRCLEKSKLYIRWYGAFVDFLRCNM